MRRIPGAVILRDSEPLLRTLAAATAVGLLLGAVIGGLGSRLAMRLLFLTSDPAMHGVLTDDGFPIGEITFAGTANLILSTSGIWVIGAFVYLAVRRFLIGPRWLRVLGCGLAAGVVVGAGLVGTEGIDFTRLRPVWLAIALFVAIPALFGFMHHWPPSGPSDPGDGSAQPRRGSHYFRCWSSCSRRSLCC
ncbi:MAG: hypothetical protein EXR65_02720 [Dehalococcoidia bacterium]|nr:hypothetical protein [Dehalococcoidia bacterium]